MTSENGMQRSYMQLNSIRKLVRLAQLVEQWTGIPEVGGPVPRQTI